MESHIPGEPEKRGGRKGILQVDQQMEEQVEYAQVKDPGQGHTHSFRVDAAEVSALTASQRAADITVPSPKHFITLIKTG